MYFLVISQHIPCRLLFVLYLLRVAYNFMFVSVSSSCFYPFSPIYHTLTPYILYVVSLYLICQSFVYCMSILWYSYVFP